MNHCFRRRGFRVAWMILLLGLAGIGPAWASHPALWRAGDADTTVYFFGTVHTLTRDTHWHFPALDRALEDSKVLYVEAADIDPSTVRPLVLKYGLDPAHPLSGKLSAQENTLLQQAASQIGMPGGASALDIMKPWLAGLTIATAPLLKAGYDPGLGADKQLQAAMEKAGKPVKGLETARQQVLFLATLPESAQLHFLRESLHDYAHARTQLTAIVDAWERGDVETIARVIVDKLENRSPTLYRVLLVDRNKAWAEQIADIMKTTPGTIFVAVGAGHLAGPDSLQIQLEKLGIHTRRVND